MSSCVLKELAHLQGNQEAASQKGTSEPFQFQTGLLLFAIFYYSSRVFNSPYIS
jgi:hypothetical protein